MTTRLYLVRHGATPHSAEDRFSGAANVFLSDDHLDAIYASPLDRTMETAGILAKYHGITPIPREGLREINHGHWEGLSRKEVEERFPDEYETWSDPFTFAPSEGESGISVLARALPVIREVVVNHKDKNVLVVSHKATLRLIISSCWGSMGAASVTGSTRRLPV